MSLLKQIITLLERGYVSVHRKYPVSDNKAHPLVLCGLELTFQICTRIKEQRK